MLHEQDETEEPKALGADTCQTSKLKVRYRQPELLYKLGEYATLSSKYSGSDSKKRKSLNQRQRPLSSSRRQSVSVRMKRSSLVSMMTKEAFFVAAPKIQIKDDGQTPRSQKISLNGSDCSESHKVEKLTHYQDYNNKAGYKTHYAAIAKA